MKIEQLLVQHFYNSKEVTLQGMGTFTLLPGFVMPSEKDKDTEMPDNAISFKYDPKAAEDEALINFIVEQTRKMKSLASADLDSYLMLGKQFLNIGKPFKIEGLGMLVKNQQGEYQFTQGHSFNAKLETAAVVLKEKREDVDISFASEVKKEPRSNKGLLIAAVIFALGLTGTATWYFLQRNKNTAEQSAAEHKNVPDTVKTVSVIRDSLLLVKPDSVSIKDGYTFKVVFLVTPDTAAANYQMNVLKARGHKIIMYNNNNNLYKLAEPFSLPLADTSRIKDSLNKYYYSGKAFIELK